jgi:hypothetical protein
VAVSSEPLGPSLGGDAVEEQCHRVGEQARHREQPRCRAHEVQPTSTPGLLDLLDGGIPSWLQAGHGCEVWQDLPVDTEVRPSGVLFVLDAVT